MSGAATQTALQGLYINLARSAERRQRCEEQLRQHGLADRYRRLEAVDGAALVEGIAGCTLSAAKQGCWLSHLDALAAARQFDGHTHILEDDFQLTGALGGFLDNLDRHTRDAGPWDILFTDIDLAGLFNVAATRDLVATVNRLAAEGRVTLSDARPLYAAGNSSYIVNAASRGKVHDLMRQGPASNLPNDLWLRQLIRDGRLRALVTLPFVTTVHAGFNDSTILGNIGEGNPSILFATLFRQSLAWGADTAALLDRFKRQLSAMKPVGDRGMIYAHLVAHYMSDDFKVY